MLPILGGNNRSAAWATRLEQLKGQLQGLLITAADHARRQELTTDLFVDAEARLSVAPPPPAALREALGIIYQKVAADRTLTPGLFLTLQRVLQIETGLRQRPATPQVPGHQPSRPEALPVLLDRSLEWFETESFHELHPVEKATLVHMRLLDLSPFPIENTRLSRFGGNFYLIQAGLPPLIVSSETNQYKAALHEALLMDTAPLIGLIAQSLEQTLVYLTQQWARPGEESI